MNQVKLLSKQSKPIEREILKIYTTVGDSMNLNPRMTKIFAYLKIYDTLTQKQLKQLTGISPGMISTTLQLFLQTDIVGRSMIPGTHTNLYWIKPERVNFVYTPSTRIIEDLERLDSYLVEKQTELQKQKRQYPLETKFLHFRLNSLRNYIEVQRRQINKKQKYSFFQESVSELLPPNKIIEYPFDIQEIEESIMDVFRYYRDDPIRNRILSIFYTHRSATQETLMERSGLSRSAVSRFLRQSLNRNFLQALPREYRQPRVYYLESSSVSTLEYILNTDQFIFSSVQRFQKILSELRSEKQSKRDSKETSFLIEKLQSLIQDIERFKHDTRFIREANQDLVRFLGG